MTFNIHKNIFWLDIPIEYVFSMQFIKTLNQYFPPLKLLSKFQLYKMKPTLPSFF